MIRWQCLIVCLAGAIALNARPVVEAAHITRYVAELNGPSESPPVPSPGIGFAIVDLDSVGHTMRVQASFSGLLGTTTVSHIHGPTAVAFAGVASVATTTPTFLGFPSGVTSGSYDHTLDLTMASSYRAGFITANGGTPATAEAALVAAIAAGKAYFNVHTNLHPGGEIRGFLRPVPEPSSLGLMGSVLLGLIGCAWRKRSGRCMA